MISVEPLTPEHFDLAAEWLSDGEINRWLTSEWRGQTVSGRMISVMLRNKRNRLLLVRDEEEACGLVGFSDLDQVDGLAMIWYLLGQRSSGSKGVISQAVWAALQVAFTEYGLSNVYAWIIDGNQPSRRVLEKNGFTELGRFRSATKRDSDQVDRIYFDITHEDFEAQSHMRT